MLLGDCDFGDDPSSSTRSPLMGGPQDCCTLAIRRISFGAPGHGTQPNAMSGTAPLRRRPKKSASAHRSLSVPVRVRRRHPSGAQARERQFFRMMQSSPASSNSDPGIFFGSRATGGRSLGSRLPAQIRRERRQISEPAGDAVRSRHGLGSERSDPGHAAAWVSAKASWIMLLSQFVHIRMGKFPKFGMIEIDCRGYQLLQGVR